MLGQGEQVPWLSAVGLSPHVLGTKLAGSQVWPAWPVVPVLSLLGRQVPVLGLTESPSNRTSRQTQRTALWVPQIGFSRENG